MADLRISELPVLLPADLEDADDLAVADYSSSETRRLTAKGLVQQGVSTLIDDGVIPGSKLTDDSVTAQQIAPDSITDSELADGAVDTAAIQDDAVTLSKLADNSVGTSQIIANAVTDVELADDAVDTDAIQDGAVTSAKIPIDAVGSDQIAPDSVGSSELADDAVDNAAIQAEAVTGDKIATDTITAANIAPDAITASELADGAVDTNAIAGLAVTEPNLADDSVVRRTIGTAAVGTDELGAVTDRGLDQSSTFIGIANDTGADSTTISGITYDRQGLINSSTALVSSDLPPATSTEIGAVLPGTGLDVEADGTLNHSNSITAGDVGGLTYDAEGHITAAPSGNVFDRDAIPIAGNNPADTGAVYVPVDPDVGISVDAVTGELVHEDSPAVTGTFPRFTVDANGHITETFTQITAAELPDDIPAAQIEGEFETGPNTPDPGISIQGAVENIPNAGLSRRFFSNTSTAYIQETQPTVNGIDIAGNDQCAFRGCLWFRPSTGQLYMFDGNIWAIIAGGLLQQENLRYCGTISANTGYVTALTDEGVAEQLDSGAAAFTVGGPLPNCEDGLSGAYFMVDESGSGINVLDVAGDLFAVGDLVMAISAVTGWKQVANYSAGGGGGLWRRTGSPPNAVLSSINAADNLDIQGGDWLKLPLNAAAVAPPGPNSEGALRWNDVANELEVYAVSQWAQVVTNLSTIADAADTLEIDANAGDALDYGA